MLCGADATARQGSQAWLLSPEYAANHFPYPTAEYKVDGVRGESLNRNAAQSVTKRRNTVDPYIPYLGYYGVVVYFQTQKLEDKMHTIAVTVTDASLTNQFIFDLFLVTPVAGGGSSGVYTTLAVPATTLPVPPIIPATSTTTVLSFSFITHSVPSSTAMKSSTPPVTPNSTPVSAIVGGTVGVVAGIFILGIAVWCFLRGRSRGGRPYYFETPTAGDIFADEGP
jgi:hypothetical protein